jgi:acetyl esterase/lipase
MVHLRFQKRTSYEEASMSVKPATRAVWLAILLAGATPAQEPAAGVKVLKDLAYGPHERNRLDLYLPEAGAGPRALVVCIHGGGWAGGDKSRYRWLGEAFAARGYAAASVTYRFAPKFRSPAQMEDVQRAVRWLRSKAADYALDPARVGAIGGSAGGHLASWLGLAEPMEEADPALAKLSCRVQAVVDCYGPVDLEAMMTSASAPIVEAFLGMPLAGNEEAYRKASPVTLVKATPPPFLLIHGTRDVGTARGQVPIEQSVSFADRLRRAGGEATLIRLEGAPHGFTGSGPGNPHAKAALEASLEFFARHLGR